MKRFAKVSVVVLGGLILVFLTLKSFLNWKTNCWASMLDGFVGAAWGVLVTAALAWIAYRQLSNIGNTSSTDFIHKLKNDFFVEETRILIDHIVENRILYKGIPEVISEGGQGAALSDYKMAYFEVDTSKILGDFPDELKEQLTKKRYYLEVEIDDFLLGHFEDIGLFEERGLIDTVMVDEEFSYYISETFENQEIKKYLRDADFCEWEFQSNESQGRQKLMSPEELYRTFVKGLPNIERRHPAHPSIEDLNELLKIPNLYGKIAKMKKGVSFADRIQSLVETTKKYKHRDFYRLKGDQQRNRKTLNRLLLEEMYAKETPKNHYLRSDNYDADMYSKFTYIYYKLNLKSKTK